MMIPIPSAAKDLNLCFSSLSGSAIKESMVTFQSTVRAVVLSLITTT